MTRRRALAASGVVAFLVLIAAAMTYLHDPPWIGSVTSGLRDWEQEPSGTRFRWASSHATFYVPSDRSTMTLSLEGVFGETDGRTGTIDITVDDRWLATFTLPDSEWIQRRLTIAGESTGRRYRRIDMRVRPTFGHRNLSVKLGEVALE